MYVNLYVDQIAKLNTVNLEDSRVWTQLERENRELIIEHHNMVVNGTLPEVLDKQGNVVPSPEILRFEAYNRLIGTSVKVILCQTFKISQFDLPRKFPGVQEINQDTKTFKVQISRNDFLRNRTHDMKIGKYFKRLGLYTDNEVNEYANKIISHIRIMREAKLELATGEDAIVEVYENGPNSCMSGSADRFDTNGIHPAAVYNSPDLACAFVRVNDRIVARAMVNLIDNQYSIIYGNGELIKPLLEDAGYTSGYLDGCRIKVIEAYGSYVMPYIDGADEVGDSDDPGYFIIGNGGYQCTETNGLVVNGEKCPCCEEVFDPEYDGIWVDAADQTYCSESCVSEAGYVYTVDMCEYVHLGDCYYVESLDRYYYHNDKLIEVQGEWYHNEDENIVYSDDQDEHIFRNDAVYIDDIDSWVDYHREHEFEEEEDEAA